MRRDIWHRATFAILAIAIALLAVVPLSERFAVGAQATVAGTGTLSGTVDAPKPFKAAPPVQTVVLNMGRVRKNSE